MSHRAEVYRSYTFGTYRLKHKEWARSRSQCASVSSNSAVIANISERTFNIMVWYGMVWCGMV